MDFSEWLSATMEELGINPSELARLSKVPQPTIFRILSGETKDPRISTVEQLERALGRAYKNGVGEVSKRFATVYNQANASGKAFLEDAIQAVERMQQIERRSTAIPVIRDRRKH